MAKFLVQLTKPAAADLDKLPKKARDSALHGILTLEREPFPDGSSRKKLKGFHFPIYRLRVGDYRALYRIDQHTVTILRVIDRQDLERIIKTLRKTD